MANKQLLKAEHAQIMHQDALHFLSQNTQKFNLIFLDPPYHQAWLPKILPLLAAHLHAEGLIYVEAEYSIEPSLDFANNWQVIKQSKAGNVFYHLLKST